MVPEVENASSLPFILPKQLDCCEICGKPHKIENCTYLNATIEHVYDTPTPSYAQLTLPQGLEVREMVGRKSVFTTKPFAKGVQFGPFIAKTSNLMDIRIEFPLQVFLSEEESVYLETYEEIFCNWLCFISAASSYEEQNLICYQIKSSIYFCTLTNIKEGQELRAWYAPYYAEKMGIPTPFSKPSDMIHSSDEEYRDIFESLQNENFGADAPSNNNNAPDNSLLKKKKRRKLSKRRAADDCLQVNATNDLPGEMLGARERMDEWHCQKCDHVETSVAAHARHLMSHFKVSVKTMFVCPYCPRRFKKDGYNREIHINMCKTRHDKKQKRKDISAKESSEKDVAAVNGDHTVLFVPCKPDRPVSQGIEVVGFFPYELSSTLIIEDKSKPGVIENNHSSCNTLEDAEISRTNTHVNGYSEESNILENISNPLDFTGQNEQSLDLMGIETQDIRSEVNSKNCCWSVTKEVGSKNDLKQETINTNKNNGADKEKLPDIIRNKIGSESVSNNQATKVHVDPPILDLSDDIDFNITKSFVDIISEDSTLEKSVMYPKVNKGLDFGFDFAPPMGIEPQVSTLDSSTFYSQEKTSFLPSSFTACDDVTDEERNRIVESFLSDTHDKYLSTDYMATSDDCDAEQTDSNLNNDCENKCEEAVKGSRKRRCKELGDFKCEICGKCFQEQKYLYRHLRKHTGEFICNFCYTVFSRKESLLKHRLACEVEASTEETFTRIRINCKLCKMQCHSTDSLKTHMETHYCKGDIWKCTCGLVSDCIDLFTNHPCPQDRKVSCERCHEQFATAKAFVEHKNKVINCRKKVHKDLSNLCEFCGKTFKTCTGVRLHRAKHGERKFECDICNKMFFRRDAMARHRLHHDDPTWECSVCLKKFTTRSTLDSHVKTVHVDSGFICTYCDKSFSAKGEFKKHMNTHKSSFVFNCQYCKRRFADKEACAKHQSTKHKFAKYKSESHSCSICHKHFVKGSRLKHHFETEHLKRYKCSYCNVVYRYPYMIKKHLLARHKDRVDEWNSPDALMAMVCFINENENKKQDNLDTTPTKDVLESAADIVTDSERLDAGVQEAVPDGESGETDVETSSPLIDTENNNATLQLVTLNLESFSVSGISEVIGPNAEEVFNLPLTYIENLQITDQAVTSPSCLPVNLNLDSGQGNSNLAINVDNALANFPLNVIPEGYQLAINDSSTEKQTTQDDAVLVNVEGLQEADAFILSDGSIVQPSLGLENNMIFYVLDSSAADSLQ